MSEYPSQHPIQISLKDIRFSYETAGSPEAAAGAADGNGGGAPADGATGSEALAGVSLDIRAGEHVCILGGNGSGKSTLLQIMNALIMPTSGTVRVMGLDPADGDAADAAIAIRRQVAMVFQHPEDQMVTSIAADDVAFGPENLGVDPAEIARRVESALAAVGMADHAHDDPSDLSGGQKQRIAIAGALAMQPRILLLDEPCAMLDAAGHRAIAAIIQRLSARGITIVHVTHFMDDALRAGRVIVMDHGRVAMDGTPAEVFSDREAVRRLGLELPFEMQLIDRLERGRAAGDAPAATSDPAPARTAPDGPAIEFRDVTFSYAAGAPGRPRLFGLGRAGARRGGTARLPHALEGVSFTVRRGDLAALVGQTGSGKSTTAELTCALKLPSTGRVIVDGVDTADLSHRRELRRHVGYVSQLPERQLFAETVYEDIAFGPRNLGLSEDEVRGRALEALRAVGLDASDELLGRSPFALSGGQQRSVALAGILAMRQPVLVLDEPMAGLDPAGRAHVRRILDDLKRGGTTLLVITHSMDDVAELADQVIALGDGRKLADGAPGEVFRAPDPPVPGLPDALVHGRRLARDGVVPTLDPEPLVLEELACGIERAGNADAAVIDLEEAMRRGAAR